MHTSKKPIGLWSAVSMGIGAMVGAGIFALLGEASRISGSAVYLSFILGGIIALFSGYSLGKLGARYPSSGGIIEYLTQAFGPGVFTGSMGVMMYFAAIISISLVAKAFANYAVTFTSPDFSQDLLNHVFSVGIVILFVLINLKGAKDVAIWERVTVAIKFLVLVVLSIAGIVVLKPELLSPSHYPSIDNVFFSLAITFFAFEGFRVITNVAEDMPNPAKTLPRAMVLSIFLVMLLYVAIAFAVFGNLPVDEVIASKDFALAQAALPIFGTNGFTVVTITALIATASAINANLYAVTNVTYRMAKDGELPVSFGKRIAHSREGLLISGILIIISLLVFDLTEIAAIGSISILFIHTITHIGHLKLINHTGGSRILVSTAIISSLAALLMATKYIFDAHNHVIGILIGFVFISVFTEILLRLINEKRPRSRI